MAKNTHRPRTALAAAPVDEPVVLARYITHKTSLYDHALAQRGRLQPRSLRQHRLLELGRPQPRDARKGHEEETKVEQRRRWDREGQEARRPAHHANARASAVRRLRRERYPRRVEPSYSCHGEQREVAAVAAQLRPGVVLRGRRLQVADRAPQRRRRRRDVAINNKTLPRHGRQPGCARHVREHGLRPKLACFHA